jgi:crossover junction endodeoxyribonuclease RusA
MLLFEFTLAGPPTSQQTRRRDRLTVWRERVARAAAEKWADGRPPVASPITLTIHYFFEGQPADVDNIVKPILDALKGSVVADDGLVTDLIVQRRPLQGPYLSPSTSPALAEGIASGHEFLHVVISTSPDDGSLL